MQCEMARCVQSADTARQALDKADSATDDAAAEAGGELYGNRGEIARRAAKALRRTGDEVTDKEFLDKTAQGFAAALLDVTPEVARMVLRDTAKLVAWTKAPWRTVQRGAGMEKDIAPFLNDYKEDAASLSEEIRKRFNK